MTGSGIDRQLFVTRLVEYFEVMSGEQWERFGHRMAEVILGEPLTHRGQTISGKPVGYTVDSVSNQGMRVAEYSTEDGFFVDLDKPKRDYEHVRNLHPYAQEIVLFSNRVCGPSLLTDIDNWEYETAQRDGVTLLVLAAREIAERVATDVLPDRMLFERIAPFLEPLRQLEAEFAATNLVPPLPSNAVRRADLEKTVLAKLGVDRVVVLTGMSGMGKTLAAIAIANDERRRRSVIWAEDLSIKHLSDLEAVDVAQRGVKLPLLGILKSRPCLLILDDLRVEGDMNAISAELQGLCSEGSAVLITSQLGPSSIFGVDMPFATDVEAREILDSSLTNHCPEHVFREIVENAGRLPLALALLNGSAREGIDWESLRHDATRIAELPVPQKAKRLADVLLDRWRAAIAGGLQVFLWAKSPRVHEGFYRRLATNAVVSLIGRLRFTTDGLADTQRLHDIAWAAVRSADPPIDVDENRLQAILDSYVRELSTRDAWTLELNHFARLHQPLLKRLVESADFKPGHVYAWLHFPGRITAGDLPDPVLGAEEAVRDPADTFRAQAAAELAEAFARAAIADAKRDGVQPDSDLVLLPFDLLLASDGLTPQARFHVRHHRAKALKRLGQHADAVAECDRLLKEAGPLPATRLLIARTLTEGFAEDSAAGLRARKLLLELLEEAAVDFRAASMSVTLAAAELLRRRGVKPDWRSVFAQYGELLESLITTANHRGLEQSVVTLASLAANWSDADPTAFVRVVGRVTVPTADVIDAEEELAAWAEIFLAMTTADPANRISHLTRALTYADRCAEPYGITHKANILTLMNRANESLATLDDLARSYPTRANDMWVLQRRAEALLALHNPAGAVEFSTRVVAIAKAGDRHFGYLLTKHAEILDGAGLHDEASKTRDRLNEPTKP